MSVNTVRTAKGVCAVCEFCGRRSRPHPRLGIFSLAVGWSCAPYPEDFVHSDGSTGTMYACPTCSRRLSAGASMTSRAYALNGGRA